MTVNVGLAVLTVSYYSGDHLQRLVESIRTETPASIFISDNAPDDDLSMFESPTVKVLTMPSNLGYGTAINRAVDRVDPAVRWLLIVNPDLHFAPGAIETLVHEAEADDSIGVAGPAIRTSEGALYPSARRLPSLRSGIGHALFADIWPSNPWSRAYLDDREEPPRQRQTEWLSGACLLVRRTAFDAVGGFDERYFMYFEDVDLCARVFRAGWRIVYAPESEVTHTGGHATTAGPQSRVMIEAHHRSAFRFVESRYPGPMFWPLRTAIRGGLWIRSRIVH